METYIQKVNSGACLSFDEASVLFGNMADGKLSPAETASVLVSMRFRGETPDEFAALLDVLGDRKKRFIHNAEDTIDTCGTGGDGKSTVNVSTAVGIILSAMGLNVVKHGNSAQSGKVGSADILKRLGFDFEYSGGSAEEYFAANRFVFMFAPGYHPALKGIGPVRREIRVPTIFNYAGPMLNPAEPDYQVVGISRSDRLEFMAEAAILGKRNNITFYSSRDGFDEVSSKEPTDCLTIRNGSIERFEINPVDFFEPFDMPVVSDAEHAEYLFKKGISGEDTQTASLFCINTALALATMKKYSLTQGYVEAMRAVNNGDAAGRLTELTGRAS